LLRKKKGGGEYPVATSWKGDGMYRNRGDSNSKHVRKESHNKPQEERKGLGGGSKSVRSQRKKKITKLEPAEKAGEHQILLEKATSIETRNKLDNQVGILELKNKKREKGASGKRTSARLNQVMFGTQTEVPMTSVMIEQRTTRVKLGENGQKVTVYR